MSLPVQLLPIELGRAAELIAQADALVVTAGAGMGVDSGLPDFRGRDGFWQAYPALGRARIEFTRIASPQSFVDWPERAWGFYGHRLALYRQTTPHQGFQILQRWASHMPHGSAVFTSNVDGHFQKAGFDAGLVHECHGSIHHLQCMDACTDAIWPTDDFDPQVDQDECLLRNALPRCPRCGALARPNILMFGDWDWLDARERQQAQAMAQWLDRVRRPVVIELGAGTAVPSVRHFGHQLLMHGQARMVRINPREWQVPHSGDVGLAAGALSALQALDERLPWPKS